MSVIVDVAEERRSGNDVRTSSRLQAMAVAEHEQPLMHTSSESVVTSPLMLLWCDWPFADSISNSSRALIVSRDMMTSRHMMLQESTAQNNIIYKERKTTRLHFNRRQTTRKQDT